MTAHPTKRPAAGISALRILWAIVHNDLLSALKNKNALTAFLMALLVIVIYRYLPMLSGALEAPYLLVYDAGNSVLLPQLESSETFQVYTYASEANLKHFLANGDLPEMGLVIPAGFDQSLDSGATLTVQGYLMNWVSPGDAARQKQLVETELSRLAGRPVTVHTAGNRVVPNPDSHGLSVTIAISLVYVLIMIALPMLPHLFLEEKQTHTLEALLVSPASAGQIVAGKAIAGLVFCLIGAGVGVAFYAHAILHWGLMLLSVLCGSLLLVALGLWLGLRIENRGQMSIMVSMAILPLLLPIFIFLIEDLFPAWLIEICRYVPTTTLFTLFRYATAGSIPWHMALLSLAWLGAWGAALLALVLVEVRRLDHPPQLEPARPAGGLGAIFPRWTGQRVAPSRRPSQAAPAAPPVSRPWKAATRQSPPSPWRMTWIIAAKDLCTAIKNKIFISLLLGVSVMAGFNLVLPLLLERQSQPTAMVYDPGRSDILRRLAEQPDLRLTLLAQRQDMEKLVTGGTGRVLGIAAPADFDQQAAAGEAIVLAGYFNYTTDPVQARQWADFFAQQISQAGGSEVQIQIDGHVLYPTLDSFGQSTLIVIVIAITIFTLGTATTPLLLIEEKETHTLAALLVSPTGLGPVVAGKALVGAAYCLLAAAVLAGLNQRLFVHWDAALLAILLTTFFAVALGLLLGALSNNPSAVGMTGGLLLLAIIALTGLEAIHLPTLPDVIKQALAWLPGTTALTLFRLAMIEEIPAGMLWANASALLAAGLVGYGLAWWRINRLDR